MYCCFLLCISLITSQIEHLLKCLLTIFVSSLNYICIHFTCFLRVVCLFMVITSSLVYAQLFSPSPWIIFQLIHFLNKMFQILMSQMHFPIIMILFSYIQVCNYIKFTFLEWCEVSLCHYFLAKGMPLPLSVPQLATEIHSRL